jgi:hypothetical protein
LNEEDELQVTKKIEDLFNEEKNEFKKINFSDRKVSMQSIDLGNKSFKDELEKRLKIVKQQTEQDTILFQSELKDLKDKEEKLSESLEYTFSKLYEISKTILKIPLTDLKSGQGTQIMTDLQDLDKYLLKFKKNKELKECKKMTRKLIFIFSRCSRLIEYMVQKYLKIRERTVIWKRKRGILKKISKRKNLKKLKS